MEVKRDALYSIKTRERVYAVQFSPYEWSKSLLAVALPSSVAVYSVKFKEETSTDEIDCKLEWESHIESEAMCLAWSPATSLRILPKCLQLAVAKTDHHISILTSDLDEANTVMDLRGHNDYINCIAYSGDNGTNIASVSDDHSVRVWNVTTREEVAKFLLTSPGMSVKFHADDSDVILVGEKSGAVRIYSISSASATLSLHCSPPLLGTDWVSASPTVIVGACSRGICVWNLSNQQPKTEVLQVGGGESVSNVALCPCAPNLVASIAGPGHTVRVTHLRLNQIPVTAQLKVARGMTWHQYLPYLVVASDRKVMFWKIDNV
ncbi:nuclear pore complex protein Nup37 [Oratosquilla oratoria]|uniref:nuclear pore complex protein Nup37 n=1 Tax=Oratosquilla oratoria TaxID=337810 RepID=UPI003F76FCFC